MYTYRITESGYRIQFNGIDTFVQEGIYANIFPGETMEEKAQNHINSLEATVKSVVVGDNYVSVDEIAEELASVETGE